MPLGKRKELTAPANDKKISMSKERIEEIVLHILDTENDADLRTSNIIRVSIQIFGRGISGRTVKKYIAQIKEDLNIK